MKHKAPEMPSQLDPLAKELLTGLQSCKAASHVVLGGYFALKHYCDYRLTHDVDAWWSEESTASDRKKVRAALKEIMGQMASRHRLKLHHRRFGDTESWELERDGKTIFSFQISARTVRLAPYLQSPWPPVRIETLTDNVASKMNALVQRGAPRDFVDIRQLDLAGLMTPSDCWHAWAKKNPDLKLDDARAEVARHLHELELRRPLDTITDAIERERARQTRDWFRTVFLKSPGS